MSGPMEAYLQTRNGTKHSKYEHLVKLSELQNFEISDRVWVADSFTDLLKLLAIGLKDRNSIFQMVSLKALKCSERIFYT
ncbi:hypothetical protein RCL1_004019 [Eukaryota sp. TZLM3-RCL]